MESQVYYGEWKKGKAGFTLWVKDHPEWKGIGHTYEEAEEKLLDAILWGNKQGVTHAVIEYLKPLPASVQTAKYCHPQLMILAGDERPDTDAPRWKGSETTLELDERLRWTDAFYELPVCRACKAANSPRTSKPITIVSMDSGYDGLFAHTSTTPMNMHYLYSDAFLELLTDEERGRLQFQPALNQQNKKKYFELIGPAGPALVGIRSKPVQGWKCSTCGHRWFGYWSRDFSLNMFVAKDDLPSPLPSMFTIGRLPDIHLVATAERWSQLVGKKGAKKIISTPIGVVAGNEIVREPELPTK
ncbi:MAG TPA: hypothetical protein PLN21_12580 [Gemmatales bacterium]|nr:hypothetical protein [Gemmatales bacterium]